MPFRKLKLVNQNTNSYDTVQSINPSCLGGVVDGPFFSFDVVSSLDAAFLIPKVVKERNISFFSGH